MNTYAIIANSTSILRSDGALIPAVADNTDYADYLAWVAAGNTVTPIPTPTLAMLKASATAALSAKCASIITGGFVSSALGAAFTYPSQMSDQLNLASSVLASTLPGVTGSWLTPFWCESNTGVWGFTMHSAAQIQQVGTDAKVATLAAMTHNAGLAAQVAAAATPAQVAAVVW